MSEFKIGDYVKVTNTLYSWQEDSHTDVPVGTILRVIDNNEDTSHYCSMLNKTIEIDGLELEHPEHYFKRVDKLTYEYLSNDNITPHDISGSIARPVIEERKVGKVQMHMVQDGFPRALKHIAEIMGWAAEVKQYKLHDWRNLPNADVELPSAGYRHGSENSIQKSVGLPALERKDHESGKLHLGHEIFNKIAELELILAGVIK